ncbi:MAG TPA: hypothetical protein VFT78_12480 [Hanamia sp.]|nr:hypothetical protein [Hanamia sp.]
MIKTVVAIFNTREEAETAAKDLYDNGFLKENVEVSSEEEYEEDEAGESSITRFFKNLFGSGEETSEKYSKVASKGFVVAVHTETEEEALEACDILDDNGAIDVNDCYRKLFRVYDNEPGLIKEELQDDGKEEAETIAKEEPSQPGNSSPVYAAQATPEIVRSRIVEKRDSDHLRLRKEQVFVTREKMEEENDSHGENKFTEKDLVINVLKDPGSKENVA